MSSLIVTSRGFDGNWPFAADHMHEVWKRQGPVRFVRLEPGDKRAVGELGPELKSVTRLTTLGARLTAECLDAMPALEEFATCDAIAEGSPLLKKLEQRGIALYRPTSEGFWGQSVSEFALGLTLAALRRIPQTYRAMIDSHETWNYSPPGGVGTAGARGIQFGDDSSFVSGTIAGKRVRVVGMGNIGARYASFCTALGADVAGWDPFAAEPCFHRTGARRVTRLEELVSDADIVAPMLPLMPKTEKIVTAAVIDAIPRGALLVVVTRMQICDSAAIRRRVLANELSLAADVFDVEPLPLNDPLLGRANVVHTPHNAGRTIHANQQFAEALAMQFRRR